MTLGQLWKQVAERVADGEREATLIPAAVDEILADSQLVEQTVRQIVTKRIRDLISSSIKPTGVTSRAPAGQEVAWPELEAVFGVAKLRLQVAQAARAMSRSRIPAEILGYIDASGVDIASCATLGELCRKANVPSELLEALAA